MNIYRYAATTLMAAAAIMWGCSGTIDPETGADETPTEPYTLSVDKTEIEANGSDAATFRITDANGLDLTGSKYIKNTSFHIEGTEEYLSGLTMEAPNRFTYTIDGTYTISAMYNGKKCSNTVNITVKNRSKYEKFHKNVALYRLTGNWCPNCPAMTTGINGLDSYSKNHSVVMEFHNADEFSVQYNATQDLAAALMSKLGNNLYPYCIYALDEGSGATSSAEIKDYIKKQLLNNPAKTGIMAASSYADGKITLNASVMASEEGTYDLGIAILKNNCVPKEAAAESVYHNVVVSISGNMMYMSQDAFLLKADAEKKIDRTIDINIAEAEKNDFRIVLFTLREKGSKIVTDNIVEFKLGESIDYILN